MKYTILFAVVTLLSLCAYAQHPKPVNPKSKTIEWRTIEEVEQLMKTEPRKVYVDIYTDWCGWCKVMDKKTFTHPKLIEYLNTKYYSIHLNAERADSVLFQNKKYGRIPNTKTNELAADWMRNKLSYPTSIFFEENFVNPQPVPGYLEIPTMEMILKYLGENEMKTKSWDKYSKEFKGLWK